MSEDRRTGNRALLGVASATACSVVLLGIFAPAIAAGTQPKAGKGAGRYQPMNPYEDPTHKEQAAEIFDQALSAYQSSKYDDAERLFKKVLELDAKNADAYFNLGAIAEWRQKYPDALTCYRKALALKPEDSELRSAIADVETKIRDRDQSQKQEAANRAKADVAEAGQNAKDAFASGDYHESARKLYQLAKAYPKEAKIQFALGQSLRALKNYSWAAYHLKMSIYLDPENDTYRKALVELDEEVQKAQDQALLDTARVALVHIRSFIGGEAADLGL